MTTTTRQVTGYGYDDKDRCHDDGCTTMVTTVDDDDDDGRRYDDDDVRWAGRSGATMVGRQATGVGRRAYGLYGYMYGRTVRVSGAYDGYGRYDDGDDTTVVRVSYRRAGVRRSGDDRCHGRCLK